MDDILGPIVEKNQSLLIHTASGIILKRKGKFAAYGKWARSGSRTQGRRVFARPTLFRDNRGNVARPAAFTRGAEISRVWRSSGNHDEDNRSLLCFPSHEQLGVGGDIGIISAPPASRYTTHVYQPDPVEDWITIIPYKNPTWLSTPQSKFHREDMFLAPTSTSFTIGRQSFLEGMFDAVTISIKAQIRCPRCQESIIRLPDGSRGTLVGRDCIKEGADLRRFEVQLPRTLDYPRGRGHDAASTWNLENNTPPLETPPRSAGPQSKALSDLCDKAPEDRHTFRFTFMG